MAKRILLVVTPKTVDGAGRAAREAADIARHSGGILRLMCVRPIPPPQLDAHDRVIADTDHQMTRMTSDAEERLRWLAADLGGMVVERVVRFGRLIEETATESETFEADLIALASSLPAKIRDHAVAWYLGHMTRGITAPVVVLPLGTRGGHATRDALAMATLRHI